jgi:hypothetical protein
MYTGFAQDQEADIVHLDPLSKVYMGTAINSMRQISSFSQGNGISMYDYAFSMHGQSASLVPRRSAAVNYILGHTFGDPLVAAGCERQNYIPDVPVYYQSWQSDISLPGRNSASSSHLPPLSDQITELPDSSEEVDTEWCGTLRVRLYTDTLDNFTSFHYFKGSPTASCHLMNVQMTCLFDGTLAICDLRESLFERIPHIFRWQCAN